MAAISIVFGILLGIIGGIGYTQAEHPSPTALIPAYFGAALIVLGVLALQLPRARMHVMHLAVLVGLVGLVGAAIMAFPKLPALLSGGTVERPLAVWMQTAMAVVCLVYVGLCVNSFIQARRRRKAEESSK
jgi:hypothetical protein